jgi:hypothetical protein
MTTACPLTPNVGALKEYLTDIAYFAYLQQGKRRCLESFRESQ